MVDDIFQSRRSACSNREDILAEPFGEYLAAAKLDLTDEPSRHHPELDLAPGARQIRNPPDISTVDPARGRPAQRALGRIRLRPHNQKYRVG